MTLHDVTTDDLVDRVVAALDEHVRPHRLNQSSGVGSEKSVT